MRTTWRLPILSICFCVFAVQGLYSAPRLYSHPQTGDAARNSEWTELNSSMEKMHVRHGSDKAIRRDDADFVRLMLPHHRGRDRYGENSVALWQRSADAPAGARDHHRPTIGDSLDAALAKTARSQQ